MANIVVLTNQASHLTVIGVSIMTVMEFFLSDIQENHVPVHIIWRINNGFCKNHHYPGYKNPGQTTRHAGWKDTTHSKVC